MEGPSDITVKEIFERVVALEAKFDLKGETDKVTSDKFRNLAFFIILIELINSLLNIWMIYIHIKF